MPTESETPLPIVMPRAARYTAVLLAIGLAVAGTSSTVQSQAANWHAFSPLNHALLQGVSGVLSLGLALLMLILQRSGRLSPAYTWVAAALAAMGVFSGFQAVAASDSLLVWFQTAKWFGCGLIFAGLWLPETITRRYAISRLVVGLAAVLACVFCAVSVNALRTHPLAFYAQVYSPASTILHLIGACGFVAAAGYFLIRHPKSETHEPTLFVALCLMFALASVLFDARLVWTASWWAIQGVMLLANLILAWCFLSYIHQAQEALVNAQRNLEEKVRKRTRSLRQQMEERYRIEQELLMTNMALKRKASDLQGSRISALNMMQDIDAARRKAEAAEKTLRGMVEELLRLKESAEASSRAKSEFLANMSHEIRTPMTAILGYTDILQENIRGDQLCQEAVETIRRNGEFLLRILNDILDLSKIESGKLEVERIRTPVSSIIHETVSLMRIRATAKNLDLNICLDSPVPEFVETDPTRLRQILVNLVANAIKFTEVGTVTIKLRGVNLSDDRPTMEFEVADTGIGMTEDQMGKLFQSFSQADSSLSRRFGGTGLGLAISQRLAEMLGGEIRVTSRPASGSKFTLSLPVGIAGNVPTITQIQESSPEKARAKTTLPTLSCKVLMVEDGVDNQRLVGFLLRKAGAQVEIVENGLEALNELTKGDPPNEYDVVLMDMQMPVMDGYEATRRLRDAGYAKPIIAMTAHAMQGDREKCLDAGCDEYIKKPVDRELLINTVARFVKAAKVGVDTEMVDLPK